MQWLSKPLRKKHASSSVIAIETKSRALTTDSWHWEVRSSEDILHYLETGGPLTLTELEYLRQKTAEYLRSNNIKEANWSSTINNLLQDHAALYRDSRDLAVLATLDALSPRAAIFHLASLTDFGVERYLRCLSIASRINPQIINFNEATVVQSLLAAFVGGDDRIATLIRLLRAVVSIPSTALLPKPLVQSACISLKRYLQLSDFFNSLFELRRFMTAFSQLATLKEVLPELTRNPETKDLLDTLLPEWQFLTAWAPNIHRIREWENGKCRTDKLFKVYDLDGPDIRTRRQSSLRLAEPHCYQHVNIQPQTTKNLERFLDVCYKAHELGTGAVDLFLRFCVDDVANQKSLDIVENSVNSNDDSTCQGQVAFRRLLDSKGSLVRRIKDCIDFLNNGPRGSAQVSKQLFTKHLLGVMEQARSQFMTQLEESSGEYMGMRVYELGEAIARASWIHPDLPKDFAVSVRAIPLKPILRVIFTQLEDQSLKIEESRLKMYLASSLGGVPGFSDAEMSPELVQMEVDFWSKPPDPHRRDIAKTLARQSNVDYTLFTTCLVQLFKEKDLYVEELRHAINDPLEMADYLAQRRELNQLKSDIWLLLLARLLASDPKYLGRAARRHSSSGWIALINNIIKLLGPVKGQLSPRGPGVTTSKILWWKKLIEYKVEAEFLINTRSTNTGQELGSLYFVESDECIEKLTMMLEMVRSTTDIDTTILALLGHLGSEWENASLVDSCIKGLDLSSQTGRRLIDHTLRRHSLSADWSPDELEISLEIWQKSNLLTKHDKENLNQIKELLSIRSRPSTLRYAKTSMARTLHSQYEELMSRAQALQGLTLQCQRRKPWHVSKMLITLGIDDIGGGRTENVEIPESLIDSTEIIGRKEYQMMFPIELSDTRKQAMGIPVSCKLVFVRLSLANEPKFCIHLSPFKGDHVYWTAVGSRLPDSSSCSELTMFTYYAYRKLHAYLQHGKHRLEDVHDYIRTIIKDPPTNCLHCLNKISERLWKPSSCSKSCSIKLRKSPLQIRLHNLFVDPLALDLLLSSLYCAAADNTFALLPGCPIADKTQVRAVIDSFLPLSTYANSPDIRAALTGTDNYGRAREVLLSWICLKYRGFIMTAPSRFHIPSMPNTKQFVVFNSSREKETAFNSAAISQKSVGGPVFHGTMPSRLFPILCDGLKVMSNTPYMLHGAASGAGIYLADEQNLSMSYAGNFGQLWANSQLSNMSVMLGCELANWTARGTHTSQDNDVIVRYVFLLPTGFVAAARQNVAPAMSSAFSNLRIA
jgi:hypothetical protein